MYPDGLLKQIAENILKSQRRKNGMSFQKQANVAEARNRFLSDYQFAPDDFTRDPYAEKQVNERRKRAIDQIDGFFNEQKKTMGTLTPEMKQQRQKMIADLDAQTTPAIQNLSIDRTRRVAENAPDEFSRLKNDSGTAKAVLDNTHGREVGTALGGLAGAGLGLLAGRKAPRRATGILQQVGGSALGALGGGTIGRAIGTKRDENKTGFDHEDILKPYEIADRLENQQHALKRL